MSNDPNHDLEKWRGNSTDSDWDDFLLMQAKASKDQTSDKSLNQICFACAALPGAITLIILSVTPFVLILLVIAVITPRIAIFLVATVRIRSAILTVRFGAAVGIALCVASSIIHDHPK